VKCDNDVCSQDEVEEMLKEERQDREPKAHILISQEQGGGGRRQ